MVLLLRTLDIVGIPLRGRVGVVLVIIGLDIKDGDIDGTTNFGSAGLISTYFSCRINNFFFDINN